MTPVGQGTAVGSGPGRPRQVAVIGAGIVGLSAALFLQRDGHEVTLIDPREPGTGASFGNAGGVVVSSAAPLGMPGMLRRVPKMLLDPRGPLVVRWRYLHHIAPWLLDLLRASNPARVEEISRARAALHDHVAPAWLDLVKAVRGQDLLLPRGWLDVYETEAAYRADAENWALARRRGRKLEVLSPEELRQLEPNLAPIFVKAVFDPDSYFMANPGRLTKRVAVTFVRLGGRFQRGEVRDIELGKERLRLRTDNKVIEAEQAVLSAGAWSGGLAQRLGVRPRLDTERGYHLMLPQPEKSIARPTYNADRSFVLSPMETGLRLTTQVEFAGLAAPPDYRRIETILQGAQEVLPSLRPEIQSRWLGFRPSIPDSLPVIGPAPRDGRVICAFGHGHLGLTQGPATGRIVADLIAGRDPGLELAPYSPARR